MTKKNMFAKVNYSRTYNLFLLTYNLFW